MNKQEITGIYSVGNSVSVIDSKHIYYTLIGSIVRLGTAGTVLYYHVALNGISTPITFTTQQLKAV